MSRITHERAPEGEQGVVQASVVKVVSGCE
jgi:hypothetical protein